VPQAASPTLVLGARLREKVLFDEASNDVAGGDVDLLDERRRIRQSMRAQVAERRRLSAGLMGDL